MLTAITCPTCDAAYRVPAESLGAGRKVRCRRCLDEWFAIPEQTLETEIDAAAAPEPATSAPEADRATLAGPAPAPILGLDEATGIDVFDDPEPIAPAPPPASARTRLPRPLAMFSRVKRPAAVRPRLRPRPFARPRTSVVVAAAGIAALGVVIGARTPIVRATPSLASLYETVGLPVNVRGLAIRDLRSSEETADGAPLLVVTGLVENVSSVALDVPRLRLAVTAGGSREVYAWTTVAARPKLEPGETATFRARLASPPAEGQAISVRFLARRDLMAALGH